MMTDSAQIALSPLLPWFVLAPLFAAVALLLLYGSWRGARGILLRWLVAAAMALILVNPALVAEQRDPISDVAVVVVDDSPSQGIGDRAARTEEAVAALTERLAGEENLEVRVVRSAAVDGGTIEETRLFEAWQTAVSDVPRSRLAGTVFVTDGQVHDVPAGGTDGLPRTGPLHVLLTGERDEADRRLTVVQAPAFGLVGQPVRLSVRVDDLPRGSHTGPAILSVRVDGGRERRMTAPVGQDAELPLLIEHGGPTVIELEVEAAPEELALANNRAAVVVNGVRDRLRVLLVSGEPHPGERTWRNLLKSDPSVDLVHFTILRPPEGENGVPINELSLIAFPIRELFELRLNEFDLIIFDRYRRRGVLHNLYLNNIAEYVQRGGAFLEASGPDFAEFFSLYRTPLGRVLPGEPTGEVIERGYLPEITDLGDRHPVTAGLEGAGRGDAAPRWGRWFRQIDVQAHVGDVVMSGEIGRPLLILDRVGEGRVAQLTSDHMWLWTRGFEGGGPQAELLRRLAHWLMKEPALEEEDLRAEADGRRLTVERRSLGDPAGEVEVTAPDGDRFAVTLEEAEPGRAVGSFVADEPGIFRLDDGEQSALAVVGELDPPELQDMRTTDERLAPAAEATGGKVVWLAEDGLPSVRRVDPERDAAGDGWIGLRANREYVVAGVSEVPLMPAALALLVTLGALMAAWRREGR
jgi:hypothetical protein